MEQSNGCTIHWSKIPTGYGSKSTPELDRLIYLNNLTRADGLNISQTISYAKELGIKKLGLFPNEYPPAAREALSPYTFLNLKNLYRSDSNEIIFSIE